MFEKCGWSLCLGCEWYFLTSKFSVRWWEFWQLEHFSPVAQFWIVEMSANRYLVVSILQAYFTGCISSVGLYWSTWVCRNARHHKVDADYLAVVTGQCIFRVTGTRPPKGDNCYAGGRSAPQKGGGWSCCPTCPGLHSARRAAKASGGCWGLLHCHSGPMLQNFSIILIGQIGIVHIVCISLIIQDIAD